MLKTLNSEVWVLESEVAIAFGAKMPTKATVLKLSNESLMVISPVKPNDHDIAALKELGDVRYIVAPNCMHHLFLQKFADHFPTAEIWGPHCLQDKRNDVHFKGTLSTKETMPWEADVDMVVVKAKAPMTEEFIFFHRSTKTVVVTDLLFNFQRFNGIAGALMARFNGCYKRLTITRVGKRFFTDKQSLHRAASHVLSWNPKNLIVAHGDYILNNAMESLKEPLADFASINS